MKLYKYGFPMSRPTEKTTPKKRRLPNTASMTSPVRQSENNKTAFLNLRYR